MLSIIMNMQSYSARGNSTGHMTQVPEKIVSEKERDRGGACRLKETFIKRKKNTANIVYNP